MTFRLLSVLCVFSLTLAAFPNPITEVEEDDDAVLSCALDLDTDVSKSPVTWTKDGFKDVVHVYIGGRDRAYDQKEAFRNRTRLFHEGLRKGNASLRLSSVRRSDAGTYTCYIRRLDTYCHTDLKVVERGQLVRSISNTTASSGPEHVPQTDAPAGENRAFCDVKLTVISILSVLCAVILLIVGTFKICKKIRAKLEKKEATTTNDAEMQILSTERPANAAGNVQDAV